MDYRGSTGYGRGTPRRGVPAHGSADHVEVRGAVEQTGM